MVGIGVVGIGMVSTGVVGISGWWVFLNLG